MAKRNHWTKIYRLTTNIRGLYNQAECYCWTQEHFLEERKRQIFDDPQYKQLPQWSHMYLHGYMSAQFEHQMQTKLVFCYPIEGKNISIDSEEYKNYSPEWVYEQCIKDKEKPGYHCWKKDVSKIYY